MTRRAKRELSDRSESDCPNSPVDDNRVPVPRFANSSAQSINEDPSNLLTEGIVVLRTSKRPEMMTIARELADNIHWAIGADYIRKSYSVGCWDLRNTDRCGGSVNRKRWRELASLVTSCVSDRIVPILEDLGVSCKLLTAIDGTIERTIYIRVKPKHAETPRHRDMTFYQNNMDEDQLWIASQCYTVWLLLENPDEEVSLKFADGSKCEHDGPVHVGDMIVFNSAIEHWSDPRKSSSLRLSVDFRVQLLA